MDLASETATVGTEATKAMDLIDDRLRGETPPEEFLIVESQTATTDEAAFSGFVDSLVTDLLALDEVDSVTSYRDGAEGLVSGDGHVTLIIATLTGDEEDAVDSAEPLVDVVEEVDGTDGFRVTTVGFGSV
ncbi:MAG: MMPL family transporter, partial [Acidimicrobiia bacterium]